MTRHSLDRSSLTEIRPASGRCHVDSILGWERLIPDNTASVLY
jgi:hypothetical protein